MAAAAILNFRKFAYLTQGTDTGWHQGSAVKRWGKLLHPCGKYEHFYKSKMAAAAILNFRKFAYLTQGIDTSWHQVYPVKIW